MRLFSAARRVLEVISEPEERLRADKWYADLTAQGHDFETYEPDEIPNLIAAEQVRSPRRRHDHPMNVCMCLSVVCVCLCVQRLRDTGNAFDKFDVEVLNGRTRYTDALSGLRQPGSRMGNWIDRGGPHMAVMYGCMCMYVCMYVDVRRQGHGPAHGQVRPGAAGAIQTGAAGLLPPDRLRIRPDLP